MNVPVARCDFSNVRQCSHSGSKSKCQQGIGRAGAEIGTNLIDGHFLTAPVDSIEIVAEIGTNLIDGHFFPPKARRRR